jgi:hypothetical protein
VRIRQTPRVRCKRLSALRPRSWLVAIVTLVSLAMAGPAMAAISPSRDANTVASTITDSLSPGVFTGASFPVIPPKPSDIPECRDGIDNDEDEKIDFASGEGDPGCEVSSGGAEDNREEDDPAPQCSNGFDDDDDGLTDFTPPEGASQDPGCSSTGDNDEGSEGASITPECADGRDNDGDDTTDFDADPGCSSSQDNREQDDRAPECSNGFDDDDDGLTDFVGSDPGCQDAQDDLEEDGATNPAPECSNDFDDDFDGRTDFSGGDPGCSSDSDLDEGSEGDPVPSSPECSNGVDDDFDGRTDFSGGDPGCQDANDNRELDDEPTQCSNGVDDDGDDKVDLTPPEGGTPDPGCGSASDLDEGSEGLPPGLDTDPAAVGDSPLGGFPTSATTFAILSSGNSTFADDPNVSGSLSQSNGNGPGTEAHGASFFDLVQLKLDLNVPEGMNCLRVDFRFLSEEFPEYVGGTVNDGFVAELDESNFTADPAANNAVVAPKNFAFDSEGKVISINTAGFSADEATGTTYDGATSKLRASTQITPGAHALYLSVFDQGDSVYDSAALIDAVTLEDAPGDACRKGTTVDTTPPIVTLATPAAGSSTDDTTPTYSGSAGDTPGDSDTVTVKIYSGSSASGEPVQTLTTTRSGSSWSVDGLTALSPGTYTARAEQTDTGGNTGFSSANTFTITGSAPDTTPPALSVTSPANGSSTNDTTPTYSGGAGDAPGDLDTVTVNVYSGSTATDPPIQTLTATRSDGTWSVTGSSPLADGTYTVRAQQGDSANNTGFSDANTFTIDTTAPGVSLTAPANGSSTNDTTPALSGGAGNAAGDLNTVTVKIYSGSSAAGNPVQTLSTSPSGNNWSTDSPPLPDGTYTARAEQSDSAANTGLSDPSTFTVDTTAPGVSLTSPANGSSTSDTTPSFGGAAGDTAGDSTTVTVKVYGGSSASGSPVQTLTATRSGTSWSVDGASPLPDGTYTAQAEQSDSAANTGVSNANTFTVDTTPPVADTTAPAVTLTEPEHGSATSDATPSFGGAAGSAAGDSTTVTVHVFGGSSASGSPVQTLTATRSGESWSVEDSPPLGPGTYTARAEQSDSAGNTGQSNANTFAITSPARRKTLADLPVPHVGKEANIAVKSGTVLVAVPPGTPAVSRRAARSSQKGLTFVPLLEARQVPIGSFLDTRRGTVTVQTATGSGNRTQQGDFLSGVFQVLQSRKKRAKGLTDLVLKGGSFNRCGARRSSRAQAALSRRAIRRLRSSASGRFRTRGRFSAATVRGTKWTVTDRCDGTLTKVTRGRVAVRDFRRRRTIVLRRGKSYLARAPGGARP